MSTTAPGVPGSPDPLIEARLVLERVWLREGRAIVLRLNERYAYPVLDDAVEDLRSGIADLLREADASSDVLGERGMLHKVLQDLGDEARVHRLVRSRAPGSYYEQEKVARDAGACPPAASLSQYWRIEVANLSPERRWRLLQELRELSAVELAYVDPPGRAAVSPDTFSGTGASGEDAVTTQGYLSGDQIGVNARYAWGLGVDGTTSTGRVRVVDLEESWYNDQHVDLPVRGGDTASFVPGATHNNFNALFAETDGTHGVATVGVIAALDNGQGVVGLAPGVELRLASHYDNSTATSFHVESALLAALDWLRPGDVVVLPFERAVVGGFGPAEVVDGTLQAIRLAVSTGVVVVEAAGNTAINLDTIAGLDRDAVDFQDSGAIVVGACKLGLPTTVGGGSAHKNLANHGSRVDCYAWGEKVVTTGTARDTTTRHDPSAATDTLHAYRGDYNGTSAASSILAGVVALVQARYRDVSGGDPIEPLTLRELLRDPTNGTPTLATDAASFPIGVMPDLHKLFDRLALVGDVYVRDTTADSGAVPSTGIACFSPDIIVKQSAVADPAAAFGEGSGFENATDLGDPVLGGADHVVYVRVKNRGAAACHNVRASVHFADASTLVTPGAWRSIGTSLAADVPAGDSIVVLGPIPWPAANVPATGHYCFVAAIGGDEDPPPTLPAGTVGWQSFLALVQENNNIAWRNFDVVTAPPFGSLRIPFLVSGAPDRARPFLLEVHTELAWGSRVSLVLPPELLKRMRLYGWGPILKTGRTVTLEARGVLRLPVAWLGPKDNYQLVFHVTNAAIPPWVRFGRTTGRVWVRQVYGGAEVGRVTFEIRRG